MSHGSRRCCVQMIDPASGLTTYFDIYLGPRSDGRAMFAMAGCSRQAGGDLT